MVLFNCLGKQQYKKQYKIFNEYIDSCLEYCCYLGSRHYALKYFVYLLFCHMAVLTIHQNPSTNVGPSSNIRQQWATSVPCLNRLRWAIWLVHNNPPSEMIHQKNSPWLWYSPTWIWSAAVQVFWIRNLLWQRIWFWMTGSSRRRRWASAQAVRLAAAADEAFPVVASPIVQKESVNAWRTFSSGGGTGKVTHAQWVRSPRQHFVLCSLHALSAAALRFPPHPFVILSSSSAFLLALAVFHLSLHSTFALSSFAVLICSVTLRDADTKRRNRCLRASL